jgi:hypothetical protein
MRCREDWHVEVMQSTCSEVVVVLLSSSMLSTAVCITGACNLNAFALT